MIDLLFPFSSGNPIYLEISFLEANWVKHDARGGAFVAVKYDAGKRKDVDCGMFLFSSKEKGCKKTLRQQAGEVLEFKSSV